ncbi:FeoA family protein [Pseudoxanthobacter sp.]|uniref:FeoA family protein n=1 Tax=Pseudoxanthobacter sp. TaxID=1925742 RepID=UPI002FE31AAF
MSAEETVAAGLTTLDRLRIGERAIVHAIEAGIFESGLATRLRALGVTHPNEVTMVRQGWFGGPFIVRAGRATEIAIRRAEAALVQVRPL